MAGSITKPKKPKSKRTPVRLRHRIEKASAAKQRKARKQAKKNPQWRSKLNKDPGIPNLFPYKEKLLHKIEEERIRKREEVLRRKEAARAAKGETGKADVEASEERMEGLGESGDSEVDVMDVTGDDDEEHIDDEANPMAALLASAKRAAEDYEKALHSDDDDDDDESSSLANSDGEGGPRNVHVPGGATSRKAYDKVFKDVVEQADVVLYVLDARDPEGTRSRDVERAVMAAAGGATNKRLILVLNKIDLVPPRVLKGWLVHLRRYFPTLPLRAAGAAPNAQTFNHRELTVQNTSGALFRALKAFAATANLKRSISVGVIGYPNVGKSSVINALLSRLSGSRSGQHNACPAGAEAGVTTAIRAVKLDKKLTLLDSPGIVFPSTTPSTTPAPKNRIEAHAHLVLLNAVPPKQIDDPIPAVALLLRRLSTSPELMDRLTSVYDLPPLMVDSAGGDATTDFLVQVARKRGRLGKGGVPHLHAAAMTVVTDWRDGRVQGWVEPPVLPVAADGAAPGVGASSGSSGLADEAVMPDQKAIVTEWAKEFQIEGLWGGDDSASDGEEMQG